MTRFVPLAALLAAIILTGCGRIGNLPPLPPRPAAADIKNTCDLWNSRVAEFRKANAGETPGGVVLLGDSITQYFPVDELFAGQHVINRGIAGDSIIGVIQRLDESVFDLSPRKIFVMIGVNNTLDRSKGIEDFRPLYEYLFARLRQGCPDAEIYVQSILPIRGQYDYANPMVMTINRELRVLAKKYHFRYVDLHPLFSDEAGLMRGDLAPDGVHPNELGYKIWADAIKSLIKE